MTTADGTIQGATKIVDNGPDSDRYNLVLLAEGYQAGELAQFAADCDALVQYMFSEPPFNDLALRCAFNVHRVDIASTDSGADDPGGDCGGTGATAATYFDATFCGDGVIRRLLTSNSATATDVLNAQVPGWHQGLVIVNSTIRGGAGGAIPTTSTGGDWREVALHELGHSAFGLADEYEYWAGCGIDTDRNNHPGAEPSEPNVTTNTDAATLKWAADLSPGVPIPTTQNADCSLCDPQGNPQPAGTIGLYEGAHYYHCGAYRPSFNCKMRNTGIDFCAVCERVIRDTLQPFAQPTTIDLDTPNVAFTDIPENTTTSRAVGFTVSSCVELTFEVTAGPTGGFTLPLGSVATSAPLGIDPRKAYVWVAWAAGASGSTANGTMTVTCVETGESWPVTITANAVDEITVAVHLVLDRSGSMTFPSGIAGLDRLNLLKQSALPMLEVIGEDHGIGVVTFSEDAAPGTPIATAGAPVFGAGRAAARTQVQNHTAVPGGLTAIGDGVELADMELQGAGGYDERAMIVFTDGHETAAKYIADVAPIIGSNPRIFAIGLGTPNQIRPESLDALVNGTGGYLLLTGDLGGDDFFLLAKYYLQILAGATNAEVVLDPEGTVPPGVEVRIPFTFNETDTGGDVVLLTPYPDVLRFALEAPSGQLVTPADAAATPGLEHVGAAQSAHYTLSLPLPVGGVPQGPGQWHAVLKVDEKVLKRRLSQFDNEPDKAAALRVHGPRYSLNVYARSNLRMAARVDRSAPTPGAVMTLVANLSEYGLPVEGRASVQAELTRPDGTTATLGLVESMPGSFTTQLVAAQPGLYRFRVIAEGKTLRATDFRREQLVTSSTRIGGDQPFPSDGPGGGSVDLDDRLCRWLHCLLESGAIGDELIKRWKSEGFDVVQALKCICRKRKDQQRPAATGVSATAAVSTFLRDVDPETRTLMRELSRRLGADDQ